MHMQQNDNINFSVTILYKNEVSTGLEEISFCKYVIGLEEVVVRIQSLLTMRSFFNDIPKVIYSFSTLPAEGGEVG
jgi:hypothetical protein